MEIAKGSRVRIDYELKTRGGDVIESSATSGPLEYEHGSGKLLPGLEARLLGAKTGAEVRGVIPAGEALGSEDAFPTKVIPRKEFPAGVELKVGSSFEAHTAEGVAVHFKVIAVTDASATARLLPAIAGKDLEFRATVLMVEDPATGRREKLERRPPPPPAAALKLEVEDGE